ncbi:hypothetical protein ACFSTI_22055 [Rhizorhabdus histidinilytica]
MHLLEALDRKVVAPDRLVATVLAKLRRRARQPIGQCSVQRPLVAADQDADGAAADLRRDDVDQFRRDHDQRREIAALGAHNQPFEKPVQDRAMIGRDIDPDQVDRHLALQPFRRGIDIDRCRDPSSSGFNASRRRRHPSSVSAETRMIGAEPQYVIRDLQHAASTRSLAPACHVR